MTEFTESSGNIFADLGTKDAGLRQSKARVAQLINEIIDRRGWTQAYAAKQLGLSQPKISCLRRGQLRGFSLEKLLYLLTGLDRKVTIHIEKEPDHAGLELALS